MLSIKTFFSGLEEFQQKSLSNETKNRKKANAIVQYASKNRTSIGATNLLLVKSFKGNEFEVPLLAPASALFPIPDGVIIEVPIPQELSCEALLKKINGFEPPKQQPIYNYFSLTFHPLNNYSPLKIGENNIELNPNVHGIHSFHLLKINHEVYKKNHETLQFEQEIQLIASVQEQNFSEKCFRIEPELVTKEIYQEVQYENPSFKMTLLDAIFNSRSQRKKQFYIYLLNKNSNDRSQLRIFLLSIGTQTKNGCITEQIKKIRVIEGISSMKGFSFFDQSCVKNVFWKRNFYGGKDDFLKNSGKKGALDNNLDYAHFQYIQKKTCKKLFKTSIGKNALLLHLNHEYIACLCEDYYIANFQLPQLTKGAFFNDKFELIRKIKIKSGVLSTKVRVENKNIGIDIKYPIPLFRDEIILFIIEIIKDNTDRHLFWNFVKDFWNFLFLGKDEIRKNIGEFGLTLVYFAGLLIKNVSLDESLNQESHQRLSSSKALFSQTPVSEFLMSDQSFYLLLKNQIAKFELSQKRKENASSLFDESPNQKSHTDQKKSQTQRILKQIQLNYEEFSEVKIRIFKIIHLLNEDFSLSREHASISKKLTLFLYVYATFMGLNASQSYRNYYTNICPQISLMFQKNAYLMQIYRMYSPQKNLSNFMSGSSFNDQLDFNVFNLTNFIENIFKSNITFDEVCLTINKFPYIFKNYYRVMKIIFLLFGQSMVCNFFKSEEGFFFEDSLNGSSTVYFLSIYQLLAQQKHFHSIQQIKTSRDLIRSKSRNYDRIFAFLLNQKISFEYIESLCDFLTYFYKSVLRLLRKEISTFLTEGILPKSAFSLLLREDLFANKFLNQVSQLTTINTGHFSHQKIRNNKHSEVSLNDNISHYTPEPMSNHFSAFLLNFPDEKRSFNESGANPAKYGGISGPSFEGGISSFQYTGLEKEYDLSNQVYNCNLHYAKNDAIFSEIYRMFNCSEIMIVNKQNYEKIQNYEEFDEEKLYNALNNSIFSQMCQRLSSSIGRGAVDLCTEQISVTDYISIPTLNITGRIKEKEKNFLYTFNYENPSDRSAINWAEFHNGVAAALSISRKSLAKIDREGLRTWIEYQKMDFSRYDHAGLIYGLGLQGVLDCFTIADIYFNLKGGIDARIIGTILGLAIFKNDNLHYMIEETKQKAFCLLLEVNMNDTSQVQISRIVQSASMIGNGIYNKGTCKKNLIETMLREIEARPMNENNLNRECHSLAAGFSLGLINLGKGSNVSASKDLELEECLFALIVDGSKGSIFDKNRENQLWKEKKLPPKKVYQASNIKEPAEGNGLLTTPSALIALTLINLKTENTIICQRLELPNTIYEIINGNPLHIFLKVVARHLIMWKSIEATENFLNSSIPDTVHFLYHESLVNLAHHYLNSKHFENLDFHNLTIIYYNIITATLLAISLKNAGTGDQRIRKLILKYISKVENLEIIQNELSLSFSSKNKIDSYSYFNILGILSLVLGILMAGRCDIESKLIITRLIRKLKYYENSPNNASLNGIYGFFMAFQMAIGFIFLGNGSLTFGCGDFQIACLLMSVYPVFPRDFNDNKYYLQALRHFYVLATEEK